MKMKKTRPCEELKIKIENFEGIYKCKSFVMTYPLESSCEIDIRCLIPATEAHLSLKQLILNRIYICLFCTYF